MDADSLNVAEDSLRPIFRRLRGYAFDPSFANRLDSSGVNTIVYLRPILPEGAELLR